MREIYPAPSAHFDRVTRRRMRRHFIKDNLHELMADAAGVTNPRIISTHALKRTVNVSLPEPEKPAGEHPDTEETAENEEAEPEEPDENADEE